MQGCGGRKELRYTYQYVWVSYTVFPRSDAAATTNFSFAGVRLLFEGGSYSRAAFINLKQHLLVTLTQ